MGQYHEIFCLSSGYTKYEWVACVQDLSDELTLVDDTLKEEEGSPANQVRWKRENLSFKKFTLDIQCYTADKK